MKKKIIIFFSLSMLIICLIIGVIIVRINNKTEELLSVDINNRQATITEVILEEYDISVSGNGSVKATLYEDGTLVISGNGYMKNNINWGNNKIVNLIIEEGVNSIGYRAFYGLSELKYVQISSTVEVIDDEAFVNCTQLQKVIIPSNVIDIKENVFNGCYGVNVYCNSNSFAEYFIEQTKIKGYYEAEERQKQIMESMKNVTIVGGTIDYVSYGEYVLLIYIQENEEEEEYAIQFNYRYINGLEKIIDDNAPTINEISLDPTNWTRENVTVTINAEDKDSGLENKAYSFDGGKTWQESNTKTYTENTNGIIIQVKDNLGNIATANEINITKIDKSTPTIEGITGNPTNWTTQNVTLTVNAKDTISGLSAQAYSFDGGKTWQESNTKTYTENTNGIIIKVKDNAGNIAIANAINITKIDKSTPTIEGITGNPTNWTTQNVTLTVNAKDTISGLSSQAYSFDGGKTWQASNAKTYTENTNGIIIKVKDNAGNVTTANEIDITKIDKSGPIIESITGNPIDWTTENVTLTVNAKDTTSGLSAQAYSFDGGKNWQTSNTKTYTENASGIIIKVRDNAGNITTSDEINITKIRRLENVSINTMPNRTNYYIGDMLDINGLTLRLNYSNADSEIISQGFTVSPEELSTIGTQEIKVSYQGKNTSFNVTVLNKPEEPTDITITSNVYIIDASIIKNIQPRTKILNFKQNITTNATILKIFNDKTELIKDNIIGTGMKLLLETNNYYKLIVKGDNNGDGQANLKDILAINKHRLNKAQLKDEYLTASDVNNDGKVDIKDILKINKFRLEKINEL